MFKRARSEEQREARRQAILGAAAAMLAEMPVAQVTLNELSRRAGLAKSNVLRYFESREAVLLELLDSAWQDWLVQLEKVPPADAVDAAPPRSLPSAPTSWPPPVAASLAARPMLCDLISAQAAVLERNVSPQVAAQYKRASIASITSLGGLMLRYVTELGEHDAIRLARVRHRHDDRRVVAAHTAVRRDAGGLRGRSGPGRHAPDFTAAVREVLEVMTAGPLARSSRAGADRRRAAASSGPRSGAGGHIVSAPMLIVVVCPTCDAWAICRAERRPPLALPPELDIWNASSWSHDAKPW